MSMYCNGKSTKGMFARGIKRKFPHFANKYWQNLIFQINFHLLNWLKCSFPNHPLIRTSDITLRTLEKYKCRNELAQHSIPFSRMLQGFFE